MFLTELELRYLTGYSRYTAQTRWLQKQGINFAISRGGRPRVLTEDVLRAIRDDKMHRITELPDKPNHAGIQQRRKDKEEKERLQEEKRKKLEEARNKRCN